MFLTGEETPFWSEPIFSFYPQVDKHILMRCSHSDKKDYLNHAFGEIYATLKEEVDRKVLSYQTHFQNHKGQIEEALSAAFELEAGSIFNDLTCNVTLNPICPRFLKEHAFDVFYKSSEKGALGLSLHEVIHFFWFHVWNGHFCDRYDEYETPSLKWILSEMVVEAIMRDERLSSLNPYFPRENGGCVYAYFQNMMVDGAPLLSTMDTLYRQNRIVDFMEASYAYCARHENEIRKHIETEENSV